MRVILAFVVTVLLTGCTGVGSTQFPAAPNHSVEIQTQQGTVEYQVWLADEPAEQRLGLGDIEVLESNQGMLFVFDTTKQHTFWMKDVEYPIDIVWLRDNQIVDITSDVQPEDASTAEGNYKRYAPTEPANMVLELSSGQTSIDGLAIGDEIFLKP